MKIIDLKTVSPLFEMERDGIKPFTERLVDNKDARFRALRRYKSAQSHWLIRITNPATGESFTRILLHAETFPTFYSQDWGKWILLHLGERYEANK